MLFNERALIFTFSGTQVRIAEIERLQSLLLTSMATTFENDKHIFGLDRLGYIKNKIMITIQNKHTHRKH